MSKGVSRLIGYGKSSEILEDSWVTSQSKIRFKENSMSLYLDNPKWPEDLITVDRNWDEAKIHAWSDQRTTKDILATHIPEISGPHKEWAV